MSTEDTTSNDIGTKAPIGERIAAWLIVIMIVYLVIAQ